MRFFYFLCVSHFLPTGSIQFLDKYQPPCIVSVLSAGFYINIEWCAGLERINLEFISDDRIVWSGSSLLCNAGQFFVTFE